MPERRGGYGRQTEILAEAICYLLYRLLALCQGFGQNFFVLDSVSASAQQDSGADRMRTTDPARNRLAAVFRVRLLRRLEGKVAQLESILRTEEAKPPGFESDLIRTAEQFQRQIGVLPFQRHQLRDALQATMKTGDRTIRQIIDAIRTDYERNGSPWDSSFGF